MINLDKLNVHEIINEEIRKFLSEELSISDDVTNATNDLYKIINNGATEFTYHFFSLGDFRIIVENVITRTPNIVLTAQTNKKEQTLKLQVAYYNNKILELPLKEEIQHEVEHLFQLSNNEEYQTSLFDAIYDKALDVFSDNNATPFDVDLARYIYCCSTKEQDAFINELYQKLYNTVNDFKNDSPDIKSISESEIYKCRWVIKNMLNTLNNEYNYTTYNDSLKKYGKNKKWFITLGETSLKRIEEKIRKVVTKAKKDRLRDTLSPKIPLNVDWKSKK